MHCWCLAEGLPLFSFSFEVLHICLTTGNFKLPTQMPRRDEVKGCRCQSPSLPRAPPLQLFTSSLFLAGMLCAPVASVVTRKKGRKVTMLCAGIL